MAVKIGKCGRQKTRTTAKKRIRRTNGGKGLLATEKAGLNHLLLQKSKRQKRLGRKINTLIRGDSSRVKKMLFI